MENKTVYIKVDPSKELPKESGWKLVFNGSPEREDAWFFDTETNLWSNEMSFDLGNPSGYLKEISLTELIERKWNEYRIVTNNEDAWSLKEWLKDNIHNQKV